MLALEIEWLTDVCRATRQPSDERPDWPMQSDRVFAALVASWGASGCTAAGRMALEWLESAEIREMAVAPANPRTVVTTYVPPNDQLVRKKDPAAFPERDRQPRTFPAVVLPREADRTHLRFIWEDAPPPEIFEALQALAWLTSYIGHSSSLVRLEFTRSPPERPGLEAVSPQSAPYKGMLNELERLHVRHLAGDAGGRRNRSDARVHEAGRVGEGSVSSFGRDWLRFAHAGGPLPDLRSVAMFGRVFRNAIISRYPDPIPEWLSGHAVDGRPSPDPHLAVVPLSDLGWKHSDGHLMGMALVLPRALEERWQAAESPEVYEERSQFHTAIASLADDNGHLLLSRGGQPLWRLHDATGDTRSSMSIERYVSTSERWVTATPILLDRHLKKKGAARRDEAAEIVARACEQAGFPAPFRVRVDKHAAVRGAPSAWPPGGAPEWMQWSRPGWAGGRAFYHAVIEFPVGVAGPMLLGAGRFLGLGLCLPVAEVHA